MSHATDGMGETANMVRAIRTISVERGHDPRSYCLMPFGGAGPLHARDVAHSLGIREILVPPAPGIICAHGLVVSDLLEDFVGLVGGLEVFGRGAVYCLNQATGWVDGHLDGPGA